MHYLQKTHCINIYYQVEEDTMMALDKNALTWNGKCFRHFLEQLVPCDVSYRPK